MHPAALFALTEAEIALHAETPRDYSWSSINPGEDAQDIDGDAGDESECQDNVSDEAISAANRSAMMTGVDDDGAANENARLDRDVDDESSVTPARSRPAARGRAAAA